MSQDQKLRRKITKELSVLDDDIHITSDEDALTFYLPHGQLERAEKLLDKELDVLEKHEHEYMVRLKL